VTLPPAVLLIVRSYWVVGVQQMLLPRTIHSKTVIKATEINLLFISPPL
jgi:hypothetical protein